MSMACVCGKERLDQEKMQRVKTIVFHRFYVPESDKSKAWSACVRAIDEFIRRPRKLAAQYAEL